MTTENSTEKTNRQVEVYIKHIEKVAKARESRKIAEQEIVRNFEERKDTEETDNSIKFRTHYDNARTIVNLDETDGSYLFNITTELAVEAERINSGNLESVEGILIAQARTLDAAFNSLLRFSERCNDLKHLETYMKLGFKAQSQCRTTLETLANIKNPPNIAFVRQQNIATQQQVNNDSMPLVNDNSSSREKNFLKQSNKLLEKQNGQRLDIGKKAEASGNDPQLEPVEAVYRPKNN